MTDFTKTIEELKSAIGGVVCQCGNPINIDRINDFWIKELTSLKAEVDASWREKIEGKKSEIFTEENMSTLPKGLDQMYYTVPVALEKGYNQALDDLIK